MHFSLVKIIRILSESVDDEVKMNIDLDIIFWKKPTNDKLVIETGWIKIVTYWCVFGSLNHTSLYPNTISKKYIYPLFGIGDSSKPRSKNINFNDYQKRLCVCNFIVTYHKSKSDIAVIYYRQKYV